MKGYGNYFTVIFLILFLVFPGVAAAADTEEQISQEFQDFLDYNDMLEPLMKLENTANDAYFHNHLISEKSRKSALSVYNNTIIPNYKKFVTGIEKIKAPNKELQAAHALYVKGAKLQLEGFTTIQKVLSSKAKITEKSFVTSYKKLTDGKDFLDEFSLLIDKYAEKVFPK